MLFSRTLLLILSLIFLPYCALVEDNPEVLSSSESKEPAQPNKDDNSEASRDDSIPIGDNNDLQNGNVSPEPKIASTYCDVQKVFDNSCVSCHFSGGQPPSLQEKDMFKLKSPYVRPRDADHSEIYERIISIDGRKKMPRGTDPLTREEIALIRKWINEGASIICE